MKTKFKPVGSCWLLQSPGGLLFVGHVGLSAVLVSREQATVYDSRDNQDLKRRFHQAVLGTPLTIVAGQPSEYTRNARANCV